MAFGDHVRALLAGPAGKVAPVQGAQIEPPSNPVGGSGAGQSATAGTEPSALTLQAEDGAH